MKRTSYKTQWKVYEPGRLLILSDRTLIAIKQSRQRRYGTYLSCLNPSLVIWWISSIESYIGYSRSLYLAYEKWYIVRLHLSLVIFDIIDKKCCCNVCECVIPYLMIWWISYNESYVGYS